VPEQFDYGPRLSDEEYDRRIVKLQSHLPPMPSSEQERAVRHQELELAINHRLGINFPKERREALWVIKENVERNRFLLNFKYFVHRLFDRSATPKDLPDDAHGIAGFMVDSYSEVLDEIELCSFFGLEKGEHPSLPLPTKK